MSRRTDNRGLRCDVREPAGRSPTVEQVVVALPDRQGAVLLESLHTVGEDGRYCIAAFDPLAVVAPRDRDPLPELAGMVRPGTASPGGVPFAAGWIGYLGYEAGRHLERLPGRAVEDLGLPRAWFGLYDTVAVFDRLGSRWHVAGVDWTGHPQWAERRPPLNARLQSMSHFLDAAAATTPQGPRPADAVAPVFERSGYIRQVQTVLRHIRAGDIYQANLTRRLGTRVRCNGLDVYRRLRRTNPANYAAWLHCGAFQVMSSSPELFLRVQDHAVLTRPIKGTRPRAGDPLADARRCTELAASAKDLAELAMVVDVERNDLGRVCSEITAAWPPSVESHPTVHHLVSDVRGRLRPGQDVFDLLRATFPGGSITGAPKIRAMEIIDALEPWARGPYCGSVGYIGLDGQAQLSVAIRTMLHRGGHVYLHVGSGIVADSDPALEFEELLAKAAGMLAALDTAAAHAPGPSPVPAARPRVTP